MAGKPRGIPPNVGAAFQRGKRRWRFRGDVFAEPCGSRSRLTRRSACVNAGAASASISAQEAERPTRIFAKDAISVSGPLTDYVSVADSGSLMHRRFCAKCGTPVFSEAEPRPQQIIVRVGTLDDPNLAKPGGVIWTKSAPSWACFDPSLPQTEAQPAPPPKP